MPISPNTLFHFTGKEKKLGKQALKDILTDFSFKVKYCEETINTRKGPYISVVPAICFCDIMLSNIKEHTKNYGVYGIGLKKEWATRNGLNPVLYFSENSLLASFSLPILTNTIFKNTDINNLTPVERALTNFIRYSKNYESELRRNGKLIKKKHRFSDEREWRYCPTSKQLNKIKMPYVIDNVDDYRSNKAKFNDPISKIRLRFGPDDINYIIVQSDEDILEIIEKWLPGIGSKFSKKQLNTLKTRIITNQQIEQDF